MCDQLRQGHTRVSGPVIYVADTLNKRGKVRHRNRHAQEEDDVRRQEEKMAVREPRREVCLRSCFMAFGGNQLCRHLDFGWLASGTQTHTFWNLVEATQPVVLCYGSPRMPICLFASSPSPCITALPPKYTPNPSTSLYSVASSPASHLDCCAGFLASIWLCSSPSITCPPSHKLGDAVPPALPLTPHSHCGFPNPVE